MASSRSTALTKRSAAGALMPPPPAPKRIKRPSVVLDEDTYVSAVSHIIRRDFFPGLAESDAQREYLNALESKDKSWIRESGKKLTQVMTPVPHNRRRAADRTRFERPGVSATDKTPSVWGADTPVTLAGTEANYDDEEGLGRLDKVDLNMSLNAFQAKYTSEDQESFSATIDKQNLKRFEKNPWLYDGNRYASKQRIAQQKVIEARGPDSQALGIAVRPSQNLDDRPAAPTMHKHTAFNSLMFIPDSVESWAPSNHARAEIASLAPPKETRYTNTRLPAETELPPRPASPTLSAICDAVSGKPRLGASEGGYTGSETPRVNGYAFVDARPPSADSDDEDAPEDLLERLGVNNASSATPFTISEASEREKMAHKMVDAISAKRAADASSTPGPTGKGLGIFTSETPRFLSAPTPAARTRGAGAQTPGRKSRGDLTPAAQRLFERMGKTPKGNAAGGFGSGSGKAQDWTPTLRVKRKQ